MPLTCTSCGYVSPDSATFCTNCGSRLGEAPGPPAQPTYQTAVDYERQRGEERTRTGLILLIIGFVISAIPIVGAIGFILVIVAVILLLISAKALGSPHRSFVVWSIVSWFIVLAALVAVLFIIIFQMVYAYVGGTPGRAAGFWTVFVIAVGAGSAAFGIPNFLITYKLQDDTGRKVLWLALAVQVAAGVAVAWYFNGFYEVFLEAVESGSPGSFPFTGYGLENLLGLANLVWAIPYYLAYKRVSEGKASGAGLT